ncbi:OPT oligopeptide transporter protein [Hirsutella rhossiliensis]|uniref:OPT oligopeptide transporter protein n=1 Tax=Hirsutella rhossiliensis TaxID=111463 RepID=A0A9P8SFF0_9HYPO|nr:OPT oligopeptide transporter protein [Hirsutella rhossiliensis]KAH0960676.1 OPT oligopeptide transporter protein [Hirsutella rhossiliensis]
MEPAPATASLPPGRHFTVRSVGAGLGVGTVICAANVYFGLQTGWVSIMSMPASLMGFGIFRLLRRHLQLPFTPVENVLLQSVACGMAIMPLGCGLVGVIPAMEYLLSPDEQGPLSLSIAQLIVWSLGLCYFGVVFAVPLRRQVIIRERLRFPSGFSTAVLISVLHGQGRPSASKETLDAAARGGDADEAEAAQEREPGAQQQSAEWATNMRTLVLCFGISGVFTICTYFFPVLRNLPIFGAAAAQTWLWTLNPSLAYVGQGIIMGAETTLHMTLGAVVGWGLLSPLAKSKGWAPGPVDDWEHGSKGWIVWVSLAIMLSDAIVSLGYIALRPVLGSKFTGLLEAQLRGFRLGGVKSLFRPRAHEYAPVPSQNLEGDEDSSQAQAVEDRDEQQQVDAPPEQRISGKLVIGGLATSVLLCIMTTYFVFGDLVPLYATVVAVVMALLLSIMGVRALGETDLNPVSGISKLAQLIFAFIVPQSNKSSVLVNLVAGAIGALQAGDLMQDLKTGHLLGAAPKAQFWGQVIGATVGAVLSAFLYRLYTLVYTIPGEIFQVPTAYVWIFTARLVTGGIAVAVGMYNIPSFTLARAAGGLLGWYWVRVKRRSNTPLIILASGFILGEGFLSIVNLTMQGLRIPHF